MWSGNLCPINRSRHWEAFWFRSSDDGIDSHDCGLFSLSQCVDVESLTLEVIRRHLVSPASIFEDLPETKLGLGQVTRLANGGVFTAAELELEPGLKRVIALDESGNLIALLQSGKTTDQYRIEYNFANHYTDRS